MGKNKKGGLIEDRVIRNPMDQMRRKLKFKERDKRKEIRTIKRELREEFGMDPTKSDVKYLSTHDPEYLQKLKDGVEEGEGMVEDAGPSNQEVSM
jgi:DNA-directed RNA polymerase specialized sigma subunit